MDASRALRAVDESDSVLHVQEDARSAGGREVEPSSNFSTGMSVQVDPLDAQGAEIVRECAGALPRGQTGLAIATRRSTSLIGQWCDALSAHAGGPVTALLRFPTRAREIAVRRLLASLPGPARQHMSPEKWQLLMSILGGQVAEDVNKGDLGALRMHLAKWDSQIAAFERDVAECSTSRKASDAE